MRIVAVADTHGSERSLGSLPQGDVFIHAGDLLRTGSIQELERAAAWLRHLPFRMKIVVAGNSDWCFLDEPEAARRLLGEDVIYLQDSAATVDGLSAWGSPWQPEYKDGAFNLPPGRALAEKWALIPLGTTILVTHSPPHGLGDRTPIGRIGCDDLRAAVHRLRPALHLFGHAHADGGVWRDDGVCFANVTTAAGRRGPTVIDIDATSGAVTDVAVPPA